MRLDTRASSRAKAPTTARGRAGERKKARENFASIFSPRLLRFSRNPSFSEVIAKSRDAQRVVISATLACNCHVLCTHGERERESEKERERVREKEREWECGGQALERARRIYTYIYERNNTRAYTSVGLHRARVIVGSCRTAHKARNFRSLLARSASASESLPRSSSSSSSRPSSRLSPSTSVAYACSSPRSEARGQRELRACVRTAVKRQR